MGHLTHKAELETLPKKLIIYIVLHQANVRIAENIAKKLGIPSEKIISIVHEYGNSSATSIPLALSITYQTKPFLAG